MNFGNVAVSAVAGTVVMTPAGVRSVTGGCTLPAVTGTVAAAVFNVTGAASYTYAITLPAAATTITSGANNMTVDTWTSTPSGTGTLSAGGSQTLYSWCNTQCGWKPGCRNLYIRNSIYSNC